MAGMPRKEVEALLKSLEKQGAKLRDTKNGVMILFPDGSTAMTHWTTSDKNAFRPLRAAVKRAGLIWPGDHPGGKLQSSEKSLKAIRKAFFDNKYKPMTTAQLMQVTGLSQPTLSRASRSGELEKVKRGLWRLPELLPTVEPDDLALDEMEDTQHEPEHPNIEYAKKLLSIGKPELKIVDGGDADGDLDFIDERDSWTINTWDVFDYTIRDLKRAYLAAGLEMEIRVWKS